MQSPKGTFEMYDKLYKIHNIREINCAALVREYTNILYGCIDSVRVILCGTQSVNKNKFYL